MKKIFTSFLMAVSALAVSAQTLTEVKNYNGFTKSEGASIWVAGTDYDAATSKGTAAGIEGLTFQGPDKFYYFHNGVFNGNSGDREVTIPELKAGQRVIIKASSENLGKLNAGKAVFEKSNMTLFNYDIDITEKFQIATYHFDVVADGTASFMLTRQGYYTELAIYDVAALTEENTATYSVKFVDENGVEIKEAITVTGAVGSAPVFFKSYEESVVAADGSNKYNYASNDFASVTLAKEGSVATVKFQSVEKYAYSLNILDLDTDETVTTLSGTCFADATTVSYPGFLSTSAGLFCVGTNVSDLEGISGEATGNFSFIVPENNVKYMNYGAPYTAMYEQYVMDESNVQVAGLYYFSEGEHMGNSEASRAVTASEAGLSGGMYGAAKGLISDVNSADWVKIDFEAGDYTLVLCARNEANSLRRGFRFCTADTVNSVWNEIPQYVDVEKTTVRSGSWVAGENIVYFTIPEDMVDSETGKVSLTLLGYDYKFPRCTQTLDTDYFLIFKNGFEGTPTIHGLTSVDGSTAIKPVGAVEYSNDIYSLSGAKMNGQNLKPGVYVKAGKLIMVK